MITFLMSALLSCEDANWIIQGIRRSDISQSIKSELIIETMLASEDECDFVSETESRR